eukprot:711917-Prymnesium_polylepis.1
MADGLQFELPHWDQLNRLGVAEAAAAREEAAAAAAAMCGRSRGEGGGGGGGGGEQGGAQMARAATKVRTPASYQKVDVLAPGQQRLLHECFHGSVLGALERQIVE